MNEKIIAEILAICVSCFGIIRTARDTTTHQLKDELIEFKKQYARDNANSKIARHKLRDRQKVILHQNKDLRATVEKTCHDIDEKLNSTRLDIARLDK